MVRLAIRVLYLLADIDRRVKAITYQSQWTRSTDRGVRLNRELEARFHNGGRYFSQLINSVRKSFPTPMKISYCNLVSDPRALSTITGLGGTPPPPSSSGTFCISA